MVGGVVERNAEVLRQLERLVSASFVGFGELEFESDLEIERFNRKPWALEREDITYLINP